LEQCLKKEPGPLVSKLFSVFGESNEKVLRKVRPLVNQINDLEPDFERLSDSDLADLSSQLRSRLQLGEFLDDLLPEAFAAVREAAKRTLGQRHYDVQIMGGITLHQGKIAEMKTGEGKTLVATLPAYLNALDGLGVHVVTVNDYLAKRDTQWMGKVYHLLGLTVSCLQNESAYSYDPEAVNSDPTLSNLRPINRKDAYLADITYGTNSEFGFDYLRDHMVLDPTEQAQQGLRYAIVDEVDNILIDEARTPLIISGPAQQSTELYGTFAKLVPRLYRDEHFTVDEKHLTVSLTEAGTEKIEKSLNITNLYDPSNYILSHYAENALRAQVVYQKDRHYVTRDGEVVIVDEFTGRLMTGRRYSDGLHQAIEAKEGLKVQRESITYASITLQNYFRLYEKLAGMTGTAATEAEEFWKIYKLDVVVIPTHAPMIRTDTPDFVFKNEEGKFTAVAREIEERYQQGQPVLVGTVSIEQSERLSAILKRNGIPHEVLNAKHHQREAVIIAQAGRSGAITVATNMAGRGTDIILGGNREANGMVPDEWDREHALVISLGGLHIIGTERHEARRIDNQLRGRSGRQGDPGTSRFYVSLEDDLMKRFAGDRIRSVMDWVGMEADEAIENRMVAKSIESAQTKVEAYHFEIRKHLVEYDDVINRHREVIYTEREKALNAVELDQNIQGLITQEIQSLLDDHLPDNDADSWSADELISELQAIFATPLPFSSEDVKLSRKEDIANQIVSFADRTYAEYTDALGNDRMESLQREVMLRTIDVHWVQHLTAVENLRQGIGLHAYGQRDPLVMFKKEGHDMFDTLLEKIQHDITHTIFRYAHVTQHGSDQRQNTRTVTQANPMATAIAPRRGSPPPSSMKVGRNDPCPCGSGKKFKRCHSLAV
jgi:preprotein translocase subunit SecA